MRVFFLLFSLLLIAPKPALSASLDDVRMGLHDKITRLVFEADTKFPYRVFQLADPTRLIIDLPSMEWRVAKLPTGVQSPLIQQSRHGLFSPDILRIVFDTHSAVTIHRHAQYQNSAGKWLLVLDIAKPDAEHAADRGTLSKSWKAYLDQQAKQRAEAANFIPEGVIPAPRRGQKPTPIIVMIDPGHGGPDPGAIGGKKTYEKDIVLKVGKRLQHHLNKLGFRALMTRDADFYIPLSKRYRIAQNQQAKLFVSLHADAAENPRATGASLYTLSEKASDREAAKLAQKENASDVLVGVSEFADYDASVQQVLLSMSQRITQYDSVLLAKSLLPELGAATKLKRDPHRSAGFAVLKSPSIPSVLVELGYMSNTKDRKKLLDAQHRDKLGAALAKGIAAYFAKQQENG